MSVRSMLCFVTAALAACLPVTVCAQWTAKAEAGVVSARGNTDSDSANTKFDVAREFTKWKHSGGFTGVVFIRQYRRNGPALGGPWSIRLRFP